MEDYEIVLGARKDNRLTAIDYISSIVQNFIEFHGDRYYGDDKAVIAGIGQIGNIPVTAIGIEKGKNTEDRIFHNFGSAHPEGYRKALSFALSILQGPFAVLMRKREVREEL